ncbi:hypothetical protein Tco_0602773, partial [Tanacetum coccineum]
MSTYGINRADVLAGGVIKINRAEVLAGGVIKDFTTAAIASTE